MKQLAIHQSFTYRNFTRLLVCSFTCFLLSACNSERKEALAVLEKAKALYGNAEYGAAQQTLDELKARYPKEVEILKEALLLARQSELKEQERNLHYCDSLLLIRQQESDSIRSYFVFEKDSEYDVAGRYIEKKAAASSASRKIQAGVYEAGDIYLKSIYRGNGTIRHNQLKISTPSGEYAQTEAIPFDGGANYTFRDDNTGLTHEIVTYQKGRDNGLLQFIHSYSAQKLTARYAGGKPYSFILSQPEIESLVKTLEFSLILSDAERLQKEKKKTEVRIQYLQEKLTVKN
jgi:hypothetical protein